MTSALLPANVVFRAYTQTGTPGPLAGGKLYFYQSGTSTPQAAYTDATGLVALANPLILDANGQASFWLKSGLTYKINLTDASGVQQTGWPVDGIIADPTNGLVSGLLATLASSAGAGDIGFQQASSTTLRTVQAKLQEFVSVLDFGADPTGVADSTAAFNSATATLKAVWVPAGTYKISSSIYFRGADIIGEGFPQLVPTAQTFAVFTNVNNVNMAKFKIRGFWINWTSITGGVAATNPAAIGISITAGTQYPYECVFEDIWMSCPYYGYYDTSLSYMMTLRNVRVDTCVTGFSKITNGGTTFLFDHCYTNGFTGNGYNFYGVNGLTLINSGFDGGAMCGSGMAFSTCFGINLISTDFESNVFNLNYAGVFQFSNCPGFRVDGMRGYNNTLATGSSSVGIVFYINNGSYGSINGVEGSQWTATGSGQTQVVGVTDTASVSINDCNFADITGASTHYTVAQAATSKVIVNENSIVGSYLTTGTNSKFLNKSVPTMSNDNGDASISNLIPGSSSLVQLFNTPMTTNRTVTFGTTGLFNGAQFRVVRTAAATGASTLTVNSGKALAAGQWVEYTYNLTAAAWFETAYGTL